VTAFLAMPAASHAAQGYVYNFAGTGSSGHAGDGGGATAAGFAYPTAVTAVG
jgi:hypothetical protein